MEIEKLSPVAQQRVLRFAKELAQVFRRIRKEAEEKKSTEANQTKPINKEKKNEQ